MASSTEGLGYFVASALAGCALVGGFATPCVGRVNFSNKRNAVTTVSAPGKALLAGGYLVLDRSFIGLTVAVSSRFYTTVRAIPQGNWSPEISAALLDPSCCCIRIESPQFHSTLTVCYDAKQRACRILQGQPNDFVETTVWLALVLAHGPNGEARAERAIEVKLRAHNDFYSQIDELEHQGLARVSRNLATVPAFNPNPVDEAGRVQVAKTGLGSSAALTTSLVGALLQYLGVVDLSGNEAAVAEGKMRVHNLGQISHSLAQGKVGSGFDVASAVFGTHIYRRFDPNVVDSCLSLLSADRGNLQPQYSGTASFAAALHNLVNSPADPDCTDKSKWNQSVQLLRLPPGLDLVMGDVHGGSNSPVMARKVLEWRKQHKDVAEPVYTELGATNAAICKLIGALCSQAQVRSTAADYRAGLQWCIDHAPATWDGAKVVPKGVAGIVSSFAELYRLFAKSRQLLRSIGDSAGVPIEPTCQTALIDATMKSSGVLCAGVPGAGGIDALFALVLCPVDANNRAVSTEARDRVETVWANWGPSSEGYCPTTDSSIDKVCPLLLHAAGCGSDNGMQGVRVESDLAW